MQLLTGDRLPGVRRLTRFVFAAADQGFYALSGFAVNLLLARSMPREEYGAFAVAFAIYILAAAIHEALVSEPVAVFGARAADKQAGPKFAGAAVPYHLAIGVTLGTVTFLGGLTVSALDDGTLGQTLIVLGWTMPALLPLWLARRVCYVSRTPGVAALASASYFVAVVGLSLVTSERASITAPAGIAIMAASSAVVALGTFGATGVLSRLQFRRTARDTASKSWRYGIKAAPTAVVRWITSNAYALLLPLLASLSAVGDYRAASNLTMPALLAVTSLTVLLLPAMAAAPSLDDMRRLARRTLAFMLAITVTIWVAIAVSAPLLLELAYDGKYPNAVSLVIVLGAVPVVAAFSNVSATMARALENPQALLLPNLVASGFTLSAGLVLIAQLGAVGAAVTLVLANIIQASLQAIWIARHHTGPPTSSSRTKSPSGVRGAAVRK